MMNDLIAFKFFFSCEKIDEYLSNSFFNLFRRSVYFFNEIFIISIVYYTLSNLNIDFEIELTKVGHLRLAL